jgi:hypothetical protein
MQVIKKANPNELALNIVIKNFKLTIMTFKGQLICMDLNYLIPSFVFTRGRISCASGEE